MKQVVILNAPPCSGKDTLADLMVKHLFLKHLKATKHEFKKVLYEAFAEHYALPLYHVMHICTDRKTKDSLDSDYSIQTGRTPREGLIHVSENIYKPKYGKGYFGQEAANKLTIGINVFSDGGGWWDELAPVVYKADRVLVCRLHREGYNFDGDSRSYYDESTMPEDIKSGGKVQVLDIYLEENRPYAALHVIAKAVIEGC